MEEENPPMAPHTPARSRKRSAVGGAMNSAKRPAPSDHTPAVEAQPKRSPNTPQPVKISTYSDPCSDDPNDETAVPDKSVLDHNIDIGPVQMREITEHFFKYLEDNDLMANRATNYKRLIKLFVEKEDYPVTAEQIINAYKVYSHEALKKIDFEAECLLLKNYLNSADAVTLFPDYPKKIPSVLDQYRMLKNFDFDIGKRTELNKQMKADHEGHAEAEQAVLDLRTECLNKLQDFMETHKKEINGEQMKFVERKIQLLQKKLFPSTTPKRNKEKLVPEEPLEEEEEPKPIPTSVFELFVQLEGADPKFEGKSQEKIEKKLRKQFDNLSEEAMGVYVKWFNRECNKC